MVFNWYDPKSKQEEKPVAEKELPPPYLLQFFSYSHLPPTLQQMSKPFHDLAHKLAKTASYNPEMQQALRKLLEAKDCAVRAHLMEAEAEVMVGKPIVKPIVKTSGAGGGAAQ